MLIHGDCLDVMRKMDANSVDAIITDPPYYKVKGEAWDNQWDTPAKFLDWVGLLCEQFERIMRPNGSLYFFASPQMAARVECEIGKRFSVLNSITWRKGSEGKKQISSVEKYGPENFRSFVGVTERIIFAEPKGETGSSLGDAIRAARMRAGLRGTDVDVALGYVRSKDPARGTELCRRWEEGSSIPTSDDYARALAACGDTRDTEDLRQEYEDLRRPFSVTARDQWSDVWDFDPVPAYPGKHPCEKPLPLLCHMLKASTKPGAVVFDPFAGSGSMGEACHDLGRQFIGVEKCPENYAKAERRLVAVKAQERLFA